MAVGAVVGTGCLDTCGGRNGAQGGDDAPPDTSILQADGEMLGLLNRAADHLGGESDWDIPADGDIGCALVDARSAFTEANGCGQLLSC